MRDILGQLKSIDLKAIDLKAVNLAAIDKKRAGTALATLMIAIGAGVYMQSGNGQAPVVPQGQPAPVQVASLLAGAESGASPENATPVVSALEPTHAVANEAIAAPANVTSPVAGAAIVDDAVDLAALELSPSSEAVEQPQATIATDQCAPSLKATVGKMAMISLDVSAPCNAGQEVEFSHAGLRFTERLDGNGALSLDLPALAPDARITALLENDNSANVEISVPEASQYRRVALVWHGATGLQLHAFEEGATYGDVGHVWAEQPGDLSRVEAGIGGYTTMLGSVASGYAADVYSFPAYLMRSLTGPDISIEAQILETTCAGPIEATFLRSNGKAVVDATPIKIAAPGCDAVGEYLVMQDLPEQMRVALN